MDSSFTIKPRPGVHKFSPRDPVPVREAADADLETVKPASGPGHPGSDANDGRQDPVAHDHVPHDVVADPESREVIYRENDVRAQADDRPHPDQALLRFRAYRPALTESDSTPPAEVHANIKA